MQHLDRSELFLRTTIMAITASFSPNAKLLLVSSDKVDDVITISCNAVGRILVNGGAVSIWGGQSTIANTAEIQVFSKGGEDKIVLDATNGVLPATELFDDDNAEVLRGRKASVQVIAWNDRLMWNREHGAAEPVSDVPRGLAVGTMIVSIALCSLVFEAGWKHTAAGKCNQTRMFDCQTRTTTPKNASSSPVAPALSPILFVDARSWMATQQERAKGPSPFSGRRAEPDCAQEPKPCQSPMFAFARSTERTEQRRHGHKG
jgi:hypothetical protein